MPKKELKNASLEGVIEVGIDEAGRGCLVGRVYTACVILPDTFPDDKYLEINDSKKLSAKKRDELRRYIEQQKAIIVYYENAVKPLDTDTTDQ